MFDGASHKLMGKVNVARNRRNSGGDRPAPVIADGDEAAGPAASAALVPFVPAVASLGVELTPLLGLRQPLNTFRNTSTSKEVEVFRFFFQWLERGSLTPHQLGISL